MAQIKALLFDLDGTLVDTEECNFLAYCAAFNSAGFSLSREQFADAWGQDSRIFIKELIPGISADEVNAIRQNKARVFGEHIHKSTANTTLVDFVLGMRLHVRTGLVTTSKAQNAAQTLKAHGLENAFDVIVNGDNVARPKPDPEGYLLALARLNLRADETVAFEDSSAGISAATAAGIPVLPILSFHG